MSPGAPLATGRRRWPKGQDLAPITALHRLTRSPPKGLRKTVFFTGSQRRCWGTHRPRPDDPEPNLHDHRTPAPLGTPRLCPGLPEGPDPRIRGSRSGTLWALASRDRATARVWVNEFAVPRAYASYQEMLDDPEVDVVSIFLPNELHRPWDVAADAAARRGAGGRASGLSPLSERDRSDDFEFEISSSRFRIRNLECGNINNLISKPCARRRPELDRSRGAGPRACRGVVPTDQAPRSTHRVSRSRGMATISAAGPESCPGPGPGSCPGWGGWWPGRGCSGPGPLRPASGRT